MSLPGRRFCRRTHFPHPSGLRKRRIGRDATVNTPCVRCQQASGTVEWGLEVSALETIQEAAEAAIATRYGIEGASITKWRWGWPGESFIVATPGGRRYFGKLFYQRDAWRAPDESLIVLEQLRDAGIDRLTFPLRTSNGGRSVYLGERRMVLFEFIE